MFNKKRKKKERPWKFPKTWAQFQESRNIFNPGQMQRWRYVSKAVWNEVPSHLPAPPPPRLYPSSFRVD